jgi:hypothetical protein
MCRSIFQPSHYVVKNELTGAGAGASTASSFDPQIPMVVVLRCCFWLRNEMPHYKETFGTGTAQDHPRVSFFWGTIGDQIDHESFDFGCGNNCRNQEKQQKNLRFPTITVRGMYTKEAAVVFTSW